MAEIISQDSSERLKRSLGHYTDLTSFTSQLSEMSTQPLKYSGMGTGLNIPISTAFPNVKLSDVQVLNASATLTDSSDWYVLQKLLYDAKNNGYKKILFPSGNFVLTKTLNLNGLSSCIINAYGCKLSSISFTGTMFDMTNSNDVVVKGMNIFGNVKAGIGIVLDTSQNCYFEKVTIVQCVIGIELHAVYYGGFNNMCVIYDCMKGIHFRAGGEVNTFDFRNTRIQCVYGRKLFYPQNTGESDSAYDVRTPKTMGVHIECNTMVVKFDGMEIEAVGYAFFSDCTLVGQQQLQTAKFLINQCYFETIGTATIALYNQYIASASANNFDVVITNCRIYQPQTFILGNGKFKVQNNQDDVNGYISIQPYYYSSSSRSYITIDSDVPERRILGIGTITNNSRGNVLVERNFPKDADYRKYNDYSYTDPYPVQSNHLDTIQDQNYITATAKQITGSQGSAKYYNAFSYMTRPIVFANGKAPVITGDDGNLYMLGTASGASLTLTPVKNTFRVIEPVNGYIAKHLWRRAKDGINVNGDTAICIDIYNSYVGVKAEINSVTLTNGKWVLSNGYTAIGTTSDMISVYNSLLGNTTTSHILWNLNSEFGMYYDAPNQRWAGFDWYGTLIFTSPIGTLANRPTTINTLFKKFIYYATDNSTYYNWNFTTSAWETFTPITVV
jgi:hypothetical protein